MKKDIFTIPNLLSFFRLLLIPVFCILYCRAATEADYILATLVLLVSTVTDFLDGKIARRFHMVSELGKALDPIADKLTHAAIAFCVAAHYPLMWAVIILMAVKEGYMAVMGVTHLRKGKKLDGAMWFGKVCTAVLFIVLLILALFPVLPMRLANTMIILAMCVMLAALLLYIPIYRKMDMADGNAA